MKQFRKLLLIPFLAAGLMLPHAVQAQPMESHTYQTASDVIDEVNALRAEQGLPPYQVNPILMQIAQSHADYQASTGIVTHYGENGSRPYQRALDAGYPVDGDLSTGGFFSENVDAGRNLSAFEVVEGWQEDSLHLNAMISAELEDIGVGVAIAEGVTYYTLVAGKAGDTAILASSSPASPGGDPFASTTGTPSTLQALATNTITDDGIVYHIVQPNEALWSIALAYETTIAELKRLNRLVTDDIFEGQKLVISKQEVETPTPQPSITVTLGIPTSTATLPVTPSSTPTSTPVPTPPASRERGGQIVRGIVLVAVIAAGLGAWLGHRKPSK
jgi:uncharacterized protein YkwD/LysM repeat protein